MGAGAFNQHRRIHKQRVEELKAEKAEFESRSALIPERRPLADDEFPMAIPPKFSRKKLSEPKPLPKLQELPVIPKSKDSPWRRGNK